MILHTTIRQDEPGEGHRPRARAPLGNTYWCWIVALSFLLAAALTRFYRVDWSVSGDDTSTFTAVRSLLDKPFFLKDFEPYDDQPRGAPVGYLLQALTFRLCGTDETGARCGTALGGSLAVGLCVFAVGRLYGLVQACIVGVMLILWPWLLFHSQSHRVYSYAFLFASAAMLTGAAGWQRNSLVWGVVSGVLTAIAVSTHAFAIVIPLGLGLFVAIEAVRERTGIQRRAIRGYVTVGVPLLLVSCGLAVWAFGHWPDREAMGWGYTGAHSLMGLAFNVTWSVALLSVVGWLYAWRESDATLRMWASVACVIVAVSVVAPRFVSFRPDYVFPVSVVFFLLAAHVLAEVFSALRARSALLGWGVVAGVLLLALPSFASYYQDGNRKDYRAAARFVQEHAHDDDLIAADTPGALAYYLSREVLSVPRPTSAPQECVEALGQLEQRGERIWYVCRFAREEPAPEVDRWFWQNAVRMLRIKQKRFDYHENILDVYLFNADRPGTAVAD